MDAIKKMCEDFLVKKVTSTSGNTFLNELRFAQTYKLDNLVKAIVDKAVHKLRLHDFKSHEMYKGDEIEQHIYKQIVEGMVEKYEMNWNVQYGIVAHPRVNAVNYPI